VGGAGARGFSFSFLRAPPFPSEIFAANVFDSLGSSERLGGFVKERKKKKKKAWQAELPFVVVPHGANTKQPESKSRKTTPPNFIIKYFLFKKINFFSHTQILQ
jgi:hypothetical protein